MKKKYLSPEIDITKFSFAEIMTDLRDSNGEDFESSGNIDEGDDIGDGM